MALTFQEAESHIKTREAELVHTYYSHRSSWPARLFHHAPLENAVNIILEGLFRSRKCLIGSLPRDVAGHGVIDLRLDAHEFVRLYFRPRTPTQFHIEGVKKKHECSFGSQAPVLIMFVLNARVLLTRDGTKFSNENMQKSSAQTGESAEFLAAIPWDKVYHEGNIAGDTSITAHKCAEVLVKPPLSLRSCLQWIYCRSEAERDTLLYCLGDRASEWRSSVRVSNDIRVFNRLLCYVEHVHLSSDGIIVELHPRKDGNSIDFCITAANSIGAIVAELRNNNFSPMPDNARRWKVPCSLTPGRYLVKIWIEGELAFRAELGLGDELV